MRVFLTCIICFLSFFSYSQRDYHTILSARLQSIRNLDYFNNTVVLYEDTANAGLDYPYWKPHAQFYQDDMVKYKHLRYRALVDNKGKQPDISPDDWALFGMMNPYIFLRDTARTEDLVKLLKADHPYIRIYAFGALARRNHNGLFQILVENLADTSKIDYFTGDFGEGGYPADLMIWYIIGNLSVQEKDNLKKLIVTKHSHLNTLQDVLRFHKPSADQYSYVRAIAIKEPSAAALVALSKYQQEQDVQLISSGFGLNHSAPWYNEYFFMAIENFPHKSFELPLIAISKEKNSGAWLFYTNEHYLRALAKYKTKECLRVLERYARRYMESDNNPEIDRLEKKANLSRIYHALKRHHAPMYDKLMHEIVKNTAGEILGEEKDIWHRNDPWDY